MRVNARTRYSPSDLTAFVACPHLTTLELAVARGELERPFRHNPHAELIRRKGDEHEAAYLAGLGERAVEIGDGVRPGKEPALPASRASESEPKQVRPWCSPRPSRQFDYAR